MEEVLINELDNMLQITRESRLKLMNDIGQSLKCKVCSETFKVKFLDNLRPELADMLNDYVLCFRCSFQTSRLIILNRRALLIDHNDNAKDNTNDGDGDCCESHITSLTSIHFRKRKVTLLDYENDNRIGIVKCICELNFLRFVFSFIFRLGSIVRFGTFIRPVVHVVVTFKTFDVLRFCFFLFILLGHSFFSCFLFFEGFKADPFILSLITFHMLDISGNAFFIDDKNLIGSIFHLDTMSTIFKSKDFGCIFRTVVLDDEVHALVTKRMTVA